MGDNGESSKSHTLLPCPFCGSEKLSQDSPYIVCEECSAYGPDPKDGRSGVELWNQRREVQRAEDHARDVLAQPEPASAVEAAIAAGQPVTLPSGTVIADPAWFASLIRIRAADLLERQALRPIPVSERLPGPEDCLPWPSKPDETHWCWAFSKGPLDDDWWEQASCTSLATYRSVHTHWLPAHALPLPEVNND